MGRFKNDTELNDYTEVVIELWTAYMVHGFNLSNIGGGDSMEGIDAIKIEANRFLDMVDRAEALGWWWDGGWIDAVQEYAHYTAATRKYGPAHEAVVFDITKYMEPKDI